jgi:hypothetical protein
MSDDPIMDATGGDDEFEKLVKDNVGLPEAPASATVRVYIDDFSTLLTVRGTEANDVVKKVEFIIEYAKKQGWKSTWTKEQPIYNPPAAPTGYSQPRPTVTETSGAPNCPVHNRAMKLFNGKYGSFWKCTAKMGEGVWCTEKVNIK